MYLRQRRLSDPSANITTFVRGGWRARDRTQDKSRSENEGLDAMGDGEAEVEAGDLRDGALCFVLSLYVRYMWYTSVVIYCCDAFCFDVMWKRVAPRVEVPKSRTVKFTCNCCFVIDCLYRF